MILIIENQTSNPLSYLGGALTVSANGNTTVPLAQLYPACRDPHLVSDCINAIVNLNDGVNDYSGENATGYLNQIALSLGGAVVGLAGSPAPSFQITIGGKDSAGNSQPARMNQFADLATNFRNSYQNITGNTTVTVKSGSGTLHGILINNNATGGTVKIYDNTAGSGTVIATVLVGSPTGGLLSANGQPTPIFLGPLGLEFQTGLTIVTTGSANNNVTAVYQ
jgi:hypothetical protein